MNAKKKGGKCKERGQMQGKDATKAKQVVRPTLF